MKYIKFYDIKGFLLKSIRLFLATSLVVYSFITPSFAISFHNYFASSTWHLQQHIQQHILINQKITHRYHPYFKEIQALYKKRNYQTVWILEHFDKIDLFLDILQHSNQEGLNPLDYYVPFLKKLFSELQADLSSSKLWRMGFSITRTNTEVWIQSLSC